MLNQLNQRKDVEQLDQHKIEKIRTDVDDLKSLTGKISMDIESIKRDLSTAGLMQINTSIQELKHSLFGVDGTNGFRSKLKEIEIRVSKIESTQLRWAGVFIGVQSLAVAIFTILNYLK